MFCAAWLLPLYCVSLFCTSALHPHILLLFNVLWKHSSWLKALQLLNPGKSQKCLVNIIMTDLVQQGIFMKQVLPQSLLSSCPASPHGQSLAGGAPAPGDSIPLQVEDRSIASASISILAVLNHPKAAWTIALSLLQLSQRDSHISDILKGHEFTLSQQLED